jgi:hypothetical protein
MSICKILCKILNFSLNYYYFFQKNSFEDASIVFGVQNKTVQEIRIAKINNNISSVMESKVLYTYKFFIELKNSFF